MMPPRGLELIRRLFHLLSYCKPHWRTYLMGTLALCFVDLLDTFTPQVVKWAIDHLMFATGGGVSAGSPLQSWLPSRWFGADAFMGGMWVYGVLYVIVVALTGVFRWFMSMYYSEGAVNLTHELRGRFFGHVQRLHAGYHDKQKTGDLMTLATSDINACREFFWVGLLIGFDTLLYFMIVPVYMAQISPKLLLASLLTLPLIPVIVARLAKRIEKRYDEMQDQLSLVAERARESFAGSKVIKSFTREDDEVRTFARLSGEYRRRALKLAAIEALQQPLLVLMLALADLVVVIYGGYLVLEGFAIQREMAAAGATAEQINTAVREAGAITVGGFIAFFSYLIRLSGPMIGLGWVISLFQRANVSMQRIEEVIHTKPAIAEPAGAARPAAIRGAIEVRNLTFAFFPDTARDGARDHALENISLHVEPGRTLAVVGPVGSGKSTLLGLIPRLYDPPPGTIFIDGVDVREISLDVLRTQIGSVPQETFLFSETILQNLALGLEGGSEYRSGGPQAGTGTGILNVPLTPEGEQWLKQCARLAQVEADILAFPKQYETLLGEKGVNLSGGQKQRVAIARAIARKPAILLLDDCLSAVDTQTEEAILAGLKEIMRERTTLIVSHRVSTVEHADEIVVLKEGRITERGRHEQLLAMKGYYFELHRKQQLEQELASKD
ncbi:MAG: ABC transporter ATP-binding protein [Planctomycetes bacterium]|nr:ABC transporter ATP-binding protein [Planctomycetota bacterium]